MTHKLKRVRQFAWVALLLTGAVQGWVFRHTVSPDGVAYLDLSDAVVHGRLSDLVNGYWSPLYPTLVGLVRVAVSPTPLAEPYWEFTLLHVVSFLGFVLALAAFEWLLRVLDDEGGDWGDSERPFASPRGLAVAYLLFAVMSLGMISVAGTVPDFFLSAAMLAAFASLLRLRADVTNTVAAIQLGLALALGALTKSIAFPIGLVVLLGLAVVSWRKAGMPAVLRSAGVFALATLPWTVALSIALGGPTMGRTGALNYAWYVNEQQPPNAGAVPALAISPDSLPLRRIAVMPDGGGTNPLWYDPARWHGDVRPRFSAIQQWRRLAWSLHYYAYIVAPLLLAAVAIGVGTSRRQTALTLRRASVVLLPCVAALLAYALVYTTSRHVAVFLLAACVTLAAAFPREAAMSAARFSAAFGLTLLAIEALAPPLLRSMVTISYGLALFMVGWLALANRSPLVRWVGSFAMVLLLWLVALMPPLAARAAPLALGVAMWLAMSRASNGQRDTVFAAELRRAFAIAAVVAMAIPGFGFGVVALRRWIVAPEAEPHPEWSAAQRLINDGVPPGSKIALLGSPENSGWARLARFQIVAVVPEDQVEAFHKLSAADRDRLLRLFARAGATRVVSRPIP